MQNPAVNTLGYSSNLNQSQKATLEEHQRLIATELPAMADTRTCLRYLRSTSFDAKKAADMMRKTARWREENAVDSLPEILAATENYFTLANYFPGSIHKTDRWGTPVYFERIGTLDLRGMLNGVPETDLIKFHINKMETLERKKKEVEAATGRYPEEGCIFVQDLKGLGWGHYYSPAMTLLQKMSDIDNNHYPEALQQMYVVNAPYLFSIIWAVMKPWLPYRTQEKVFVFGGNYLPALEKVIRKEDIPSYLGGDCKCENHCVPEGGTFPTKKTTPQ